MIETQDLLFDCKIESKRNGNGHAARLRSPIFYYGGKGNMVAKILPLIPWCHMYVEPFGGGASILLAKAPSPVEVYNDVESHVVNLFRVLRGSEADYNRFIRLIENTPYSREEFFACSDSLDEGDSVERAWKFMVVGRQSFSGCQKTWSFARTASNRGMAEPPSKWLSTIEMLPRIRARLLRVQIEHDDFRKVIARYDTPKTCFYCDPPYPQETRIAGSRKKYRHEMTDADHEELVKLLLGIDGTAVLSCYDSPLYDPLRVAGWKRIAWETACHAAGRTRGSGLTGKGAAKARVPRMEVVWIHPRAANIEWHR